MEKRAGKLFDSIGVETFNQFLVLVPSVCSKVLIWRLVSRHFEAVCS